MIKLDYVLSATSYIRLVHSFFLESAELQEYMKKWIDIIHAETDHDFSILYNAFTESGELDKHIKTGIYDKVKKVYADSGGLQIVTTGSAMTPAIKTDIYNKQVLSDYAMCFDEIPVSTVDDRSKRGDWTGRYFDDAKLDRCATETGANINEQCEIFEKKNSKAVPVAIIHGNSLDKYRRWYENMMKEIKPEYHNKMTSLAISSAAAGQGRFEELKKYFCLKFLNIESANHLHVLGVGSIGRLLPLMFFYQNGLYQNFRVSYDSTTHSGGSTMGRANLYGRAFILSREYNDKYQQFYDGLEATNPLGFSVEDFFEALNSPAIGYYKKTGNKERVVKSGIALCMFSILNFIKSVEAVLKSKDKLEALIGKDYPVYQWLIDINNESDYARWESEASKYLHSVAIRPQKMNTLDEFFS